MKRRARAARTLRRARKRARVGRRRLAVRLARDGAFMVKRTFNLNTWFFATTNTTDFWKYYSFALTDLPSYGEFSPLWDNYKICAIKVTFRPTRNGVDANPANGPNLLTLHTLVDQRSTVTPSGLYTRANCNTFLENGTRVKSRPLVKPISVYFKPMVRQQVGDTSVPAMPRYAGYTSIAYPALGHFGFHAFVTDANMSANFGGQGVDVFVTYYMKFRSVK